VKGKLGSGRRHSRIGGRQHCRWRYREPPVGPARSKNLGTHGISMCENREVPWPPVLLMVGAGREGNANGGNPLMHDRGKSDGPVVSAKPLNNAAVAVAEVVEERDRPRETRQAKRAPDAEPA
jgi:hypothetical protein